MSRSRSMHCFEELYWIKIKKGNEVVIMMLHTHKNRERGIVFGYSEPSNLKSQTRVLGKVDRLWWRNRIRTSEFFTRFFSFAYQWVCVWITCRWRFLSCKKAILEEISFGKLDFNQSIRRISNFGKEFFNFRISGNVAVYRRTRAECIRPGSLLVSRIEARFVRHL